MLKSLALFLLIARTPARLEGQRTCRVLSIAPRRSPAANPLVLMRITSNLVSNAIKYTREGKVLIGTRMIADQLRIEVHDTGPGLSQAEFELAKQRAVRLERDAPVTEGKGLGLTIVCKLASQNDMQVRLLPLRQCGSSIVVELGKVCNSSARTPAMIGPTDSDNAHRKSVVEPFPAPVGTEIIISG